MKIIGKFKNDFIKDKAKMYLKDKLVYEGGFKDMEFNGYGELNDPNGVSYKGNFLNGLKDGYGERV